jgi:hypothetical protein
MITSLLKDGRNVSAPGFTFGRDTVYPGLWENLRQQTVKLDQGRAQG